MNDLFFNKIAFCVLGTGLLMNGLNLGSRAMFPAQAAESLLDPGFPLLETVAEVRPDYPSLFASADVNAGRAVSAKCQQCHNLEADRAVLVGPPLYGVVGRDIGSASFNYSKGAGSLSEIPGAWDYEKLDHFLRRPKAFAPNTAMGFGGLKKQADRINLIAYLRTLTSGEPMPLPSQ